MKTKKNLKLFIKKNIFFSKFIWFCDQSEISQNLDEFSYAKAFFLFLVIIDKKLQQMIKERKKKNTSLDDGSFFRLILTTRNICSTEKKTQNRRKFERKTLKGDFGAFSLNFKAHKVNKILRFEALENKKKKPF